MDIKEVKFGRTTRKDFSKVGDYIEMPNLIKVQKDSYDWYKKVIASNGEELD